MKQKKLIVTILILVILAAVGITIALLTRPEAKPDDSTPVEATMSDATSIEATTPDETPLTEEVKAPEDATVTEPSTQDTAA